MGAPILKTGLLTCGLMMFCFLLGCISWLIKRRVWYRVSCGRDPNLSPDDPACRSQTCDLCSSNARDRHLADDV